MDKLYKGSLQEISYKGSLQEISSGRRGKRRPRLHPEPPSAEKPSILYKFDNSLSCSHGQAIQGLLGGVSDSSTSTQFYTHGKKPLSSYPQLAQPPADIPPIPVGLLILVIVIASAGLLIFAVLYASEIIFTFGHVKVTFRFLRGKSSRRPRRRPDAQD